ncbi:lipopolysaccharide biosynthesis protein [Salinibius halmophilus]|uniref:lipopolysaccharide biosynthesis protein n=1 Tax=Salinibius halmophilus TaxID=1853216 RepID=UPI000E66E34B|nr:oligosaccharide flippase family protein [Salinibius halmophilus]
MLKRFIAILTSSAASQIVLFIGGILVAKILSPSEFGLLNEMTTLLGWMLPLACFSFAYSIPLENRRESIYSLAFGSGLLSVLAIIVVVVPIWFYLDFRGITLSFWVYFLSLWVFVFVIALYQVCEQSIIFLRFTRLHVKCLLFCAISTVFFRVWVSYFYSSGVFAALGNVFGFLIYVLTALFYFRRERNFYTASKVNLAGVCSFLRKYWKLPVFKATEGFINLVSQGAPIIVLGVFWSAEAAGYYALVKLILVMPMSVLSKSLVDSLFPFMVSKWSKREKISKELLKLVFLKIVLGLLLTVLVFAFGEWALEAVFSEKWSKAGEYMVWVALWSSSMFVVCLVPNVFLMLDKAQFNFYISTLKLLSRSAVIVFFVLSSFSAVHMVAVISLVGLVINICVLFFVFWYLISVENRRSKVTT